MKCGRFASSIANHYYLLVDMLWGCKVLSIVAGSITDPTVRVIRLLSTKGRDRSIALRLYSTECKLTHQLFTRSSQSYRSVITIVLRRYKI